MKKIISAISLIALISLTPLIFPPVAKAATATTSAQELLDRVATKVAEIANRLKRAYFGKITSVGTTSYIITTANGDKTVTTNDVTTFFRIRSGNTTEVNFNALRTGDDIAAFGNVDPQTSQMTAREIIAKIKRLNIVGKIISVNKSLLTIQPSDGPQTTIDLSSAVSLKKISLANKTTSAKMSDFDKDAIVFVIAYKTDASDTTPLSVLKAVVLQ